MLTVRRGNVSLAEHVQALQGDEVDSLDSVRFNERPGQETQFRNSETTMAEAAVDIRARMETPSGSMASNSIHTEQPKKRVVKRSEQYERARDTRRLQKWIAKREAAVQVVSSQLMSLGSMKMAGGYAGHRGGVEGAVDEFSVTIVVPDNKGGAARVIDRTGRVFVYRACKGAATEAANSCAQAAATFLSESQIPPSDRNGKRGNFDQYYFILHRESQQRPRMHSYFLNHLAEGLYAAAIMQPLRELVDDAFRRQFPDLHAHYVKVLTFILEEADSDLVAPFFPFASFAVNYGTVVCKPHKDTVNYGPGVCCIVPFGNFDPTESARLALAEAGVEVKVGPGIPVIIPSAVFTHSNTLLSPGSFRGSIVLWSNGSLFQYYDLGGRAVNTLTPVERQHYVAGAGERLEHALQRFPIVL